MARRFHGSPTIISGSHKTNETGFQRASTMSFSSSTTSTLERLGRVSKLPYQWKRNWAAEGSPKTKKLPIASIRASLDVVSFVLGAEQC